MSLAATRLYILRHGEAQQRASTDAARQLTTFGREQVRAQAQCFGAELCAVESVYVSPYVRAQQTADELLAGLAKPTPAHRHEAHWLTPDTPVDVAIDALAEVLSGPPVLLISHQPLVSYLISFLSDEAIWQVNMDTASLASLDVVMAAKSLAELKSISPALVTR